MDIYCSINSGVGILSHDMDNASIRHCFLLKRFVSSRETSCEVLLPKE